MAALEWRGLRGLLWDLDVVSLDALQPILDMWVIHLEDNNLARKLGKSLILQILADLEVFRDCCPLTHIMVSYYAQVAMEG